jgi:hypothetical protein
MVFEHRGDDCGEDAVFGGWVSVACERGSLVQAADHSGECGGDRTMDAHDQGDERGALSRYVVVVFLVLGGGTGMLGVEGLGLGLAVAIGEAGGICDRKVAHETCGILRELESEIDTLAAGEGFLRDDADAAGGGKLGQGLVGLIVACYDLGLVGVARGEVLRVTVEQLVTATAACGGVASEEGGGLEAAHVADDETVLIWCEALGWVREVKFGQRVVNAEAGQAGAVGGVLSGGIEEAFG